MRLAVATLAAAACFAASVLALAWSWADLTVSAARAPEQAKRFAQITPNRWREAFHRLHQARALDPLNANYTAELGRYHAWLAWRSDRATEASRSYRQRSRAAYAEAIARRPTWGYAWANYAEATLLAGVTGPGANLALERAMVLAPWEAKTQIKSLLVGLSLWNGLSEAQRNEVTATLRRALFVGDDVELIIRMAVQSGQVTLLEGMLTQARHRVLLGRVIAQSGR